MRFLVRGFGGERVEAEHKTKDFGDAYDESLEQRAANGYNPVLILRVPNDYVVNEKVA